MVLTVNIFTFISIAAYILFFYACEVSWMNGGLSCIETESTLAAATPVEETKEAEAPDNLSRQLCRQWLKFRYLKVGQACGESCKRCHILPASLGQMYSDYAFKGLSKVQRKTIFDAVEKERQTPASLPRADLDGEPSHQPEGGVEPGKRKEEQVTGAPFRKRSKIA